MFVKYLQNGSGKRLWLSAGITILLSTLPQSFAAAPLVPASIEGQWRQGRLLLGRTQPKATVLLDGRALRVDERGRFVFGLDRDAKGPVSLSIQLPGQAVHVEHHLVAPEKWSVQRIQGLDERKVNPPEEVGARIAAESARIKQALASDSEQEGFAQHFQWPVTGRVSGVFGSQRILNGVPKQPHYGLDVAVPTGTPVRAPADGVVTLAESDLYFTGGTLIIDHGHGVSSILVHLSKLSVPVGAHVEQGQVIAASGMTGRATGPHLHWGIYWFDAHIDPLPLVK